MTILKPILVDPPTNIPSRDRPATFPTDANDFVLWQTSEYSKFQQMVDYVEQESNTAQSASDAAQVAAGVSGAVEWFSGGSWTAGDPVWSPVDGATYRAKTTHSGLTTDPSLDTTNWANVTIENTQEGTHDNTPERALLPGAFGVAGGTRNFIGPPGFDIDLFDLPAGNYRTLEPTVGVPDDADWPYTFDGNGFVRIWYSDRYCFQEWSPRSVANVTFFRRTNNLNNAVPIWLDWQLGYNSATILGSVSENGSGIPRGAVIESGSNVNGEYVRFADGTQICTRTFPGTASSATWTYPAAFAAIHFASAIEEVSSPFNGKVSNISLTDLDWLIWDTENNITAATASGNKRLFAKGLWHTN